MKSILLSVMMAVVVAGAVAGPSDVTVTQVSNGRVQIDYTLTEMTGFVSVDVLTNGVSVAAQGTFSGDVGKTVAPGERHVQWTIADAALAELRDGAFTAEVKVQRPGHFTDDYLVVRLSDGQMSFYPNAAAIPDGVADVKYKTSHMLFRRIPAAGVTARLGRGKRESQGSASYVDAKPSYLATFEDDYFMAVYECTIGQSTELGFAYAGTMGASAFNSAASHYATHQTDWPHHPIASINASECEARATALNTRYAAADPNGALQFALPNDDEWEFACRANCPRDLYFGYYGTVSSRSALGTYENTYLVNFQTAKKYYGGDKGTAHPNYSDPMPVGQLTPNAWGLYDMLGNVSECIKTTSGTYMLRGGSVQMSGENSLASWRGAFETYYFNGFRICCRVK